MIRWRVADVIISLSGDRDDMSLGNFERVCGFYFERKLLRHPAKHNLSNLTRRTNVTVGAGSLPNVGAMTTMPLRRTTPDSQRSLIARYDCGGNIIETHEHKGDFKGR